MTMLQFRESLVRSLLLGVPFENVKPGPRERSTSQMKRTLANHELEQIEESGRGIRRRCAGCYAEIRERKSKEENNAITKKKNFLF